MRRQLGPEAGETHSALLRLARERGRARALLLLTLVSACSSAGSAPGKNSTGGAGGSGASAGSGGAGGKAGSGGSSQDSGCPPECFVNNECVVTCGDVPQDFGCCNCPANMIDARSCPADAGDAKACGNVGGPCPGATDCPGGLVCVSGVCAPSTSACAAPPGGVGCDAGETCLQHAGQQNGMCVTSDDRACLCAGYSASSFDCP